MYNKGNLLFDLDKLLPRPIPAQARFEADYYDFLTTMPQLVETAFFMAIDARKRKDPRAVNKNWFANEMSGNIAFLVMREFPQYVKFVRGTYCLNLNYEYECYVKKLTNTLKPSYKHSNTSWANYNQKAQSATEQLPVIYIGYTANKSNDKILGCYAVCRRGNERLWVSDLTAIDLPSFGVDKDTIPDASVDVQVRVRAKKNVK